MKTFAMTPALRAGLFCPDFMAKVTLKSSIPFRSAIYSSKYLEGIFSVLLTLRRNGLGFAGRLQLEYGILDLLVDLDIGIFGEPIIATGLEQLLLH